MPARPRKIPECPRCESVLFCAHYLIPYDSEDCRARKKIIPLEKKKA